MSTLTVRQQQIFQFIFDQTQREGRPPTVREIGQAFGIRSPNGVYCHLAALRRKGVIETGPGARGIRLLGYQTRLDAI